VKLTRGSIKREAAGENSYSSSRAKELDKRAAYLQALDTLDHLFSSDDLFASMHPQL
jgi:hypothetical protein